MAIDYAAIAAAGGIPKVRPRVLERHEKDTASDKKLRAAYAKVDARDKKVCQVTGATLVADAGNDRQALERDHLASRGAHPERIYDADNILTVSRFVHKLLQRSALVPVDKRGRETTHVSKIAGYQWNRNLVAPGKEPLKLKARVTA